MYLCGFDSELAGGKSVPIPACEALAEAPYDKEQL